MNKTFKIYGAVLLVILILIGLLEVSKKPVINWQKNFDPQEKSPFGLYVFAQEASGLFSGKIVKETESPFDYFSQKKIAQPQNILLVNQMPDGPSQNKILEQAAAGSTVMWVQSSFSSDLQKKLKFRTGISGFENSVVMHLTDYKFLADSLTLDRVPDQVAFTMISPEHEVLGTFTDIEGRYINFIKIKYGKGIIYLHTEPLFLTNFYLLKRPGALKYLSNSLGYLPDRNTVWFVDGKTSASRSGNELSFILSQPALRYAWWLFLASLLLYTLFNLKRKQRIIPIIEPKKNKSVEFVQSIGNLYLQEGDFHDMMAKKSRYFLHRVRQELMLETDVLNDEFVNRLQMKTGKKQQDVFAAVELMKKALSPCNEVRKEDLFTLNRLLDDILK